jgi:hypothetical protein
MAGVVSRLSRRTLLLAGFGTIASTLRGTGRAAQEELLPFVRSCAQHPGVQLLLDWKAARPVMMTLEELMPPVSWQFYNHPTMPLLFRFPPDWRGEARWPTI